MTKEERERLLQLCELAAREQDPQRLLIMVQEINTLLETKQERLKQLDAASTKSPA